MARRCNHQGDDFIRDILRFVGEVVTIYTTSGGESGRGFTGVLVGIDPDFVRLIAEFGPAPGCALGSCCDERHRRHRCDEDIESGSRRSRNRFDEDEEDFEEEETRNRFECGRIRNTGAIVDIPINRIAAFVHNTLS